MHPKDLDVNPKLDNQFSSNRYRGFVAPPKTGSQIAVVPDNFDGPLFNEPRMHKEAVSVQGFSPPRGSRIRGTESALAKRKAKIRFNIDDEVGL